MTGASASKAKAEWKTLALLGVLLSAGLAGCSAVDSVLFGGAAGDARAAPPAAAPVAGAMPGTLPGAQPSVAPEAPVTTIQTMRVADGRATGTIVGQKAQELRTELTALQGRIETNAQRLAALRTSEAAYAAAYHDATARIAAKLQVGTTRGNPELVSQWNAAQDSLDRLATDINGLNALGSGISTDDSRAHYVLDTVRAAFGVSGAVDEDHRQLRVLEDETNQTIVLIERLLREITQDVERQTSYVANERANLTTLANAIKNGQVYGANLGPTLLASAASPMPVTGGMMAGVPPLVVIRFDRANVQYEQILYTALAQALEARPDAGFEVVAVAPTAGTAAAVQLAQSEARRNAEAVMRAMSDMGVPATRLALSSTTDPSVPTNEVRVFVR